MFKSSRLLTLFIFSKPKHGNRIVIVALVFTLIFSGYTTFDNWSYFLVSKFKASLVPKTPDTYSKSRLLDVADTPLLILGWTTLWRKPYPLDGLSNCENKKLSDKCRIVNDRNLLNKSSALIFHARDISYWDLPSSKLLGAKFVFFSHESPQMTFITLRGLPVGYFDWTMTYRLDSDIYFPYGYLDTKNITTDKSWIDFVYNKTKIVAWFVSNCETDSRRERYVHELAKYINVDIYGDCGSLSCPKDNYSACNNYLRRDYKFYLSLENAACKDYITEKFFHRLEDYVVPIVLRRSDYVKIAPNMSFIALDDFESPRDLAKYLLYLHENVDEYLKFFYWRNEYEIVTRKMSRFCYCDLCEKLLRIKSERTKNSPQSVQQRENSKKLDIHKWWYVDGACDHKFAQKLLTKKPKRAA